MKNVKLKLTAISALSILSTTPFAGGFEPLSATGYTVSTCGAATHQPTCGTTAYKICNPTGNYGSGVSNKNPTAPNDTCFITPAPITDLSSPEAGFTLVTSAIRTVTMNNTYTGFTNKSIGSVLDVVWRNAAQTECIYGTKFTATSNDYNTGAAGNQYFEANGIARAGFYERPVEVGYARTSSTSEVLYRAGRTFTSVQHRGSGATYAPGYYDLPLTGYSLSINGLDSISNPLAVPDPADQEADINENWVEFTTDVNARDDDGSTTAASAMYYIKSTCSSAAPATEANAIRLRQTFQEESTDGVNPPADQRFIEVPVSGFVPPGGSAAPTPVSPY